MGKIPWNNLKLFFPMWIWLSDWVQPEYSRILMTHTQNKMDEALVHQAHLSPLLSIVLSKCSECVKIVCSFVQESESPIVFHACVLHPSCKAMTALQWSLVTRCGSSPDYWTYWGGAAEGALLGADQDLWASEAEHHVPPLLSYLAVSTRDLMQQTSTHDELFFLLLHWICKGGRGQSRRETREGESEQIIYINDHQYNIKFIGVPPYQKDTLHTVHCNALHVLLLTDNQLTGAYKCHCG